MKRLRNICVLVMSGFPLAHLAGEQVNHLMAGVGSVAVTSIDLEDEIKNIRNSRNVLPKSRPIKHLALDSLIEKAIIQYTAKEEVISVTEARIDNEIKREIKASGLKNENELKKKLRKVSIRWEEYRKNLAQRIMTQQVAQQKIKPLPPTDKEIKDFYAKNARRLGIYKYYYRLISIPFRQGNTKDEMRVNQEMTLARRIAKKNFSKAASKYSRHSSRRRGGLMGWQRLDEVALLNPRLAALVEQSPVGEVSQEYPLGNAYFIVKVEKKARIPFNEIKDRVAKILYSQKQQKEFARWLSAERRRLAVKVFLKGYRTP